MAVSSYNFDVIASAIKHAAAVSINQLGRKTHIPPSRRNLVTQVDVERDVLRYCIRIRLRWCDRDNPACVRACDVSMTDLYWSKESPTAIGEQVVKEIYEVLEQLNFRGELFFMRLHRMFPGRIDKVQCNEDGHINVRFKNGHTLTTDDGHIDSQEFLAACAMVYDL